MTEALGVWQGVALIEAIIDHGDIDAERRRRLHDKKAELERRIVFLRPSTAPGAQIVALALARLIGEEMIEGAGPQHRAALLRWSEFPDAPAPLEAVGLCAAQGYGMGLMHYLSAGAARTPAANAI